MSFRLKSLSLLLFALILASPLTAQAQAFNKKKGEAYVTKKSAAKKTDTGPTSVIATLEGLRQKETETWPLAKETYDAWVYGVMGTFDNFLKKKIGEYFDQKAAAQKKAKEKKSSKMGKFFKKVTEKLGFKKKSEPPKKTEPPAELVTQINLYKSKIAKMDPNEKAIDQGLDQLYKSVLTVPAHTSVALQEFLIQLRRVSNGRPMKTEILELCSPPTCADLITDKVLQDYFDKAINGDPAGAIQLLSRIQDQLNTMSGRQARSLADEIPLALDMVLERHKKMKKDPPAPFYEAVFNPLLLVLEMTKHSGKKGIQKWIEENSDSIAFASDASPILKNQGIWLLNWKDGLLVQMPFCGLGGSGAGLDCFSLDLFLNNLMEECLFAQGVTGVEVAGLSDLASMGSISCPTGGAGAGGGIKGSMKMPPITKTKCASEVATIKEGAMNCTPLGIASSGDMPGAGGLPSLGSGAFMKMLAGPQCPMNFAKAGGGIGAEEEAGGGNAPKDDKNNPPPEKEPWPGSDKGGFDMTPEAAGSSTASQPAPTSPAGQQIVRDATKTVANDSDTVAAVAAAFDAQNEGYGTGLPGIDIANNLDTCANNLQFADVPGAVGVTLGDDNVPTVDPADHPDLTTMTGTAMHECTHCASNMAASGEFTEGQDHTTSGSMGWGWGEGKLCSPLDDTCGSGSAKCTAGQEEAAGGGFTECSPAAMKAKGGQSVQEGQGYVTEKAAGATEDKKGKVGGGIDCKIASGGDGIEGNPGCNDAGTCFAASGPPCYCSSKTSTTGYTPDGGLCTCIAQYFPTKSGAGVTDPNPDDNDSSPMTADCTEAGCDALDCNEAKGQKCAYHNYCDIFGNCTCKAVCEGANQNPPDCGDPYSMNPDCTGGEQGKGVGFPGQGW